MRLSLVGAVLLALLGGQGGAVLAQAGAEGPTLTPVTGTQASFELVAYPEVGTEGSIETYRGVQFRRTFEWSDPRLPSLLLSNVNSNWHVTDEGEVSEFAQTHRLVGEESDWVGTEYGFQEEGLGSSLGLHVYRGEGAYEGLSAMIARGDVVDEAGNTGTECSGYIFESELPPMPDPVEPPAG
ncbi:MAG: hypothetical protein AB1Z63_12445 [Candidatus Limnocylindrales bacterium]